MAVYKFKMIFPIVFCVCALAMGTFAQQDRRWELRATGKAVVEAVVASIHDSGIFPDDNRLLRRIAYVASRDGMSSDTFRRTLVRYGIWQTPKEAFRNINSNPIVQQKLIAIKQFFDIDWDRVTEGDLRKPLISGLAARLLLAIISDSHPIPEQGAIEAQARYWHQYFSRGRTGEVPMFSKRVKNLEDIEQGQCSLIGVDLIFLLDSSGSIGSGRYSSMLTFVEDMVSVFDIGPTQTRVGITIYSSTVQTSFLLNTYQDKPSLINAIRQVPYIGGGTNTAAGLNTVLTIGFLENNGVRPSKEAIPRVLFVLTDGASNNFAETVAAANAIHEQKPMIKVYAVGIGGGANSDELEAIATHTTETPSPYVLHQQSFSEEDFEKLRDQLTQEICRSSAQRNVGEDIERPLEPGQQSQVYFQCPEDGLTVRICAPTGKIQAFGSHCTSSPSKAHNNFMFDIEQGSCDDIYQECGSCDEGVQRGRRQSVRDGQVVYIVIEGVEETKTSTFVLETTSGDTSTPKVNLRCNQQQRGELLTVTCTSNQDLVNVSCSLDEGPFEPCSLPFEVDLSEGGVGDHQVQIQVTDVLSLQDGSTIKYSVEPLDLRCKLRGETMRDAFVVQCSPTNPLERVMCSYDEEPLHACTLPYIRDVTDSGFEQHTLRIMAMDIYGLTSDVVLTYTKPRMKIRLINSSPRVRDSSVYVDFDISRHATSLRCYLRQLQPITMESGAGQYGDAPGIQEKDCSSNLVVYGNLEPGEYAFTVVANTSDGDSAVLTRKFWIGSGRFDCTTHLINDGVSVAGTTASVQFIGVGIFNSYQCSVDGKVLAGVCRSPLRVRGLLPEQYQVEVVPQGCQGEAYGFSKTFIVET